jgi:hypothetical protein
MAAATMGAPARRPAGRAPAAALALALAALLAAAVGARLVPSAAAPASRAQLDAALAQRGVAWIWPASNGPVPPRSSSPAAGYREAAVLVETLVIHADGVERLPRLQPLALPAGVRLLPVLHVEAAVDAPDALSEPQVAALLAAVARHAGDAAAGAGLLQLDFEAPRRERAAYEALVARVHAALPAGVRLSVTALAHWCTESGWLDRLPVDEVVPMLYRLGPHAAQWRRRWSDGGAGLAARCRGPALGFATDDPPPAALLARTPRPYLFDESAWSNASRPRLAATP